MINWRKNWPAALVAVVAIVAWNLPAGGWIGGHPAGFGDVLMASIAAYPLTVLAIAGSVFLLVAAAAIAHRAWPSLFARQPGGSGARRRGDPRLD